MTNRPLLLGHRGARAVKSIPENSIASFDRAIAEGCDGFEFDVRLTRDGTAVIHHDPKQRLSKIAHSSAEKLKNLPRLEDVLARYHQSAFLNIELKVAGLEQITANLLGQFPPVRGYVVSSFLPEVLQTLSQVEPSIPLGLICENPAQLSRWNGLPVESVILSRKLAVSETIQNLKTAGKKVFVWTVNRADEMSSFAQLEVDGIISDKTELLCRTLKKS